MIAFLLEKFSPKRFIKFLITGGVALAIDVVIYFVLTRYGHLYYLLSRAISLAVAVVWNFSVNRVWTFEATSGRVREQAPRFLVVIISTSLLNLGLMHIGVSYLHFNDLLVLVVVAVITTVINFSAHSFWSYAKNN